jgi:hypothetical protein
MPHNVVAGVRVGASSKTVDPKTLPVEHTTDLSYLSAMFSVTARSGLRMKFVG